MVAAACGNAEIVRLMLSKGADVKAQDRRGMSALYLAARTGELATVKLLLSHDADPNAADFAGRTSLFHGNGGSQPRGRPPIAEAWREGQYRDRLPLGALVTYRQ